MIVLLSCSDDAWGEISGSVEERKQHLEQSNKNLDIFQTNELQLGQWLSEKELMMSVLGPLSIDPNMLKMQKQQVQVSRVQDVGNNFAFLHPLFLSNIHLSLYSRYSRMSSRAANHNMSNLRKQPPPS